MTMILRPGLPKEFRRSTWQEKLGFILKGVTSLFLILGLCLIVVAWCFRGLLFYRG